MKHIFSLAAGAALTFALGCGGNSASPTAPGQTGSSEFTGPNAIVSLKIEAPSALTVGESAQLKVVANLAGGAVLDVTGKALFSVTDSAVATVSASGELRALSPGDCGLTALVGSVSAKLNTHIKARADGIARLEIRGKVELDLGEKTQLLAIATLDTGAELDVTARASFTSSNDAVLRVSASGLLEAVGVGTSDLLSVVDGVRAAAKVNVRGGGGKEEQITRIEIRGKVDLDLGEKTQLRAIATFNTGEERDVTPKAAFHSGNDAVLRVSPAGSAEAVGVGATALGATVDGVRGSRNANVRLGPISRLDIGGASDLTTGDRATVRVMATTANGAQADVTSQTELSSSNHSVLKVNADGVIEALGPGSCDLIAIHGSVRAMLRLNVKPKATATIVKLRIEGLVGLRLLQTTQLKAIATMSDNTEVDVTGRVSWSTSNALSLLVNASGLLTALAPGDCLISGIVDGVKASVTVRVTL